VSLVHVASSDASLPDPPANPNATTPPRRKTTTATATSVVGFTLDDPGREHLRAPVRAGAEVPHGATGSEITHSETTV
jgi:hypothetical protein